MRLEYVAGMRTRRYVKEGHGEKVMREARRLLVETEDVRATAQACGVPVTTVYTWNTLYGWVKLRRGRRPRVGPRRTKADTRFWLDNEPQRWRCDCGRLTVDPRCPQCWYVPAWAEKGAAA